MKYFYFHRFEFFSHLRSTFTEAKFNADDYANELMELKKEAKPEQLKSHAGSSSRKRETEEGKKKISFIEQANKRKECDKLAAFVMSIDLMLNHVLHQLVVNSMTTIQVSPLTGLPDTTVSGFHQPKACWSRGGQTEG